MFVGDSTAYLAGKSSTPQSPPAATGSTEGPVAEVHHLPDERAMEYEDDDASGDENDMESEMMEYMDPAS